MRSNMRVSAELEMVSSIGQRYTRFADSMKTTRAIQNLLKSHFGRWIAMKTTHEKV